MLTMQAITDGLRDLRVRAGDKLLVHSSLRKFGHVHGGAESVIGALMQVVGLEGTVLVPTLTGTHRDGPDHPPYFDVRTTSCWTGIIPETLRKWPGAVRSLGPTHSVAGLGSDARRLLAGHEDCRTPCGEGSPYIKLAKARGRIIFFGVGLDCNTMFHSAEELAGVSYHLQTKPTRCRIVDEFGQELERDCVLHNWAHKRRFAVMEEVLFAKGILKRGYIGNAKTLVVEADAMLTLTLDLLKRNPWHLVTRSDQRIQ